MPFCSYCGREISELAVACAECGHPNEARVWPAAPPGSAPVRPGVYASFGRRAAALLFDSVPFLLVIGFTERARVDPPGLTDWGAVLTFFIQFLYRWLMIAYVRGQTLGKMALGIRITRPDGSPVGPARAAARAGMSLVSNFPIALGYLWAAWDREHRTWHDIVADTRAYRVR